MNSSPTINFQTLLAVISEENPTGKNLREEASATSLYYQIKDARNAARAKERQLIQDDEPATIPPEWHNVHDLAIKILSEDSKDLEICAWLIEALVRKHGFAGLRDGFHLAQKLCELFWDNLYPLPSEDGFLSRLAALSGLNGEDSEGTLITPIASIALTQGTTSGPFALWHYQQASEVNQISDPEKKAKRIAMGATTLESIEKAIAETDNIFFRNLLDDIEASQSEFLQLTKILDEKCGQESPPTSRIREIIAKCLDALKFLGKKALLETPTLSSDSSELVVSSQSQEALDSHQISHRDKAFEALQEIANFFIRTEPHSPVPYLLQKAVRWGKMPLSTLLNEWVVDDNARKQLFTLVGLEEK